MKRTKAGHGLSRDPETDEGDTILCPPYSAFNEGQSIVSPYDGLEEEVR